MAAARAIPAGVVWVNQWQGGGPERLYEPSGDSGMGATGSRAAYDAATRTVPSRSTPAHDGERPRHGVVDAWSGRLLDLSHRIHAHPELAFEETRASTWVAESWPPPGST